LSGVEEMQMKPKTAVKNTTKEKTAAKLQLHRTFFQQVFTRSKASGLFPRDDPSRPHK
jgi:hypothetical protein